VFARFDDLPSGRSLRLTDFRRELVATRPDEVVAAFEEAAAAAEAGAWVAAFVAYEAAPAFDRALRTRDPDPRLPLAWFGVFGGAEPVDPPAPADPPATTWESDTTEAEHAAGVEAVRRLIARGDTYQVNLTHRLTTTVDRPADLYAAMLHAQRPRFGAFLEFGGRSIVSASPELFFSLDGDLVTTKPMKGTMGRGRWTAEDEQHRARLAASEKDRAENLMIVDLLRNDLGRVARFGSVAVGDLFAIERYETVWQMTSTITSQRRPEARLVDVFGALFPCGSVTGAPKASTMAAIADLEASPRGIYCGAIGLLEPGGKATFSVPIRTVAVDPDGLATFGTGGGITWDSIAEGEWAEAAVKARLLTTRRPSFSLLETLRLEPDGYPLLDRHLARLAASAAYFGREVDLDTIRAVLEAVPRPDRVVAVRLTVAPDGDGAVAVREIPAAEGLVRLAIDPRPIDRHDVFRFHKTTVRAMYDEAAARFPDADDVVSVNDRGEVVETTIGNLVVHLDGRRLTPPLDSGCLPGVGRAVLLDEGLVEEGDIAVERLRDADAIEVVNAVRGRRPAILR
jgi:para-aminobenzoate synthetase/4-amino-4-deoxychorismate lyase